MQMLDELLDVLPARLFDLVVLGLLRSINRQVWCDEIGNQERRLYWERQVVVMRRWIVVFIFIKSVEEGIHKGVVDF